MVLLTNSGLDVEFRSPSRVSQTRPLGRFNSTHLGPVMQDFRQEIQCLTSLWLSTPLWGITSQISQCYHHQAYKSYNCYAQIPKRPPTSKTVVQSSNISPTAPNSNRTPSARSAAAPQVYLFTSPSIAWFTSPSNAFGTPSFVAN